MASTPNVYVGLQIQLNKQLVDLVPETPINKIDEKGFKLKLASPVELGKLKETLPSILDSLGVDPNHRLIIDNQGKPNTQVALIDSFLGKVLDANLTINAFEYEKPKTDSQATESQPKPEDATKLLKSDSKYVFIASATWSDTVQQPSENQPKTTSEAATEKPEFFKLRGIIIGVSNGYEDNDDAKNFLTVASEMNKKKQIAPATDTDSTTKPTTDTTN